MNACYFCPIGTNGALFLRYIYGRSFIENPCAGFRSASWKLPQKHLEHHGFYCSSDRVRLKLVDALGHLTNS